MMTKLFHFPKLASPTTKWAFLGALLTLCSPALAADPLVNPATGHYYVGISTWLRWPDAKAAAEAAAPPGYMSYLATITSPSEYEFVTSNVPGFQFSWLGGYQPDPNVPADEGWAWVTGEGWSYENWAAGEPNDYYGPGSEPYLTFWANDQLNDQHALFYHSYIVEFQPLTIHIDGCDTGVPDVLVPSESGPAFISSLIGECAAVASNHGEFVSCVSELTNDLKKAGLITGKQKGAIQSCAAHAEIP